MYSGRKVGVILQCSSVSFVWKEHRLGGQQYDKLASRPQRRSRKRDEDESKMRDESDEEIPPPKRLKTGKGKQSKKTTEKEVQGKKPEDGNGDDDKLPDIPL